MKHWTDSKTIRYLIVTWLSTVLLSLVPMLNVHQIDWWALGSQSVASMAAIIVRMFASDVEGPFDVMNRKAP